LIPELHTLSNGLPVGYVHMPWAESMAFGIFLNVGSRQDPNELSGLAHFAEHLFFKGTKQHNARQLSRLVESEGGSADAYTSEEHTVYYVRGPAEQATMLTELLLEMFLESTLPAEEVERERGVISEEIAMYHEQPSSHAEDMLCQIMWPGHPLGRAISGDEASLNRIQRKHLVEHMRTYHRRGHVVMAFAGPQPSNEVLPLLDRLTKRRLKAATPPEKPKKNPKPAANFKNGPVVQIDARPQLEQTQLALAFHAPGRQGDAPYALKILNVMLGENTSSLLWQEVREKRGWCYQIDTDVTTLSDTGLFQIFAGVDPKNTHKAIEVIWRHLEKFTEKPISDRELKRAISYATGSGKLGLEGTANTMLWVGESLLFHGKVTPVAEAQDKLREVTADQVSAVAKQIFQAKTFGAAIVGPEDQKALEAATKKLFS
jgi:predicted Zn-dependent peptidase